MAPASALPLNKVLRAFSTSVRSRSKGICPQRQRHEQVAERHVVEEDAGGRRGGRKARGGGDAAMTDPLGAVVDVRHPE
jgi:hypothetical protein